MTTKKTDGADSAATNDAAPKASETSPQKHYATRTFKDAGPKLGEEREFQKGAELTDVEPGALANYVAGGLATTEQPAS